MIPSYEERCPHCNVDLKGDPIPKESQKVYGSTHLTLKIGFTDIRIDSIIKWKCPVCEGEWSNKRFKD